MSVAKRCARRVRSLLPERREACVRNTAVVRCMVVCMEERRVDVGVLPGEERNVGSSAREGRPVLGGQGWWGADGAW